MKNDFINELGHIGFTARMKRISDLLLYSAIDHYKQSGLGIEPNWHLIFLILKEEKALTVTEIAARLRFSHPAIIKIVRKMEEEGFLERSTDASDSRKQLISLSKKAIRKMPVFEKEWSDIEIVIKELISDDFLADLDRLEQKLGEKNFSERYRQAHPAYEVRNAKPEEFEEIGALMVRVYSQLEGFPNASDQPEYYRMLAQIGELTKKPETELLVAVSPQGKIDGAVVYFSDMKYYGSGGTATKEKNASGFRLLAVDHDARGRGVGKLLSRECIRRSTEKKHQQMVIHSTKAMKIAWKMYEKLGFKRSEDLDFMQEKLPVFGFRLQLQ
ncbi:GNAT family N-acetyltransferase [Leptobacterium flavescens]|uniref:GNAT family N-acetyltransferase n=1 Tax=Leptobacterium flavescens TaxID=472055 RepID=A0A6P0UKT3_9FLAO|nr:bifunctional helix-turn-helix transcriptional regulator/GNAT family N-acetyltransferase [Leptobacterium flavescens]NER13577.1 GNAT family N-acetyltransferase [Leptobacterium flavescens]